MPEELNTDLITDEVKWLKEVRRNLMSMNAAYTSPDEFIESVGHLAAESVKTLDQALAGLARKLRHRKRETAMGETKNMDAVEIIKSKAFEAGKVAAQCRWKVQLLKEMFEAMADQNIPPSGTDNCFLGAMTISEEIIDQLVEVGDALETVTRNAVLCSPDPEKLKAREEEHEKTQEDLRSMGIDPAAKKGLKPPVEVEDMLKEE